MKKSIKVLEEELTKAIQETQILGKALELACQDIENIQHMEIWEDIMYMMIETAKKELGLRK